MKTEQIVRLFAGFMILTSLALAHFYNPRWLWLTSFVGFNLMQSSVTGFCPLEIVLRRLGIGSSCCDR